MVIFLYNVTLPSHPARRRTRIAISEILRQVAAIDIRIDHTERILNQLGKSLEQLHGQAASLERSGKAITPELKNKIAKVERQLQDSHSFIEKRRLQKDELASQFADDLDRYRELKGLTKKSE